MIMNGEEEKRISVTWTFALHSYDNFKSTGKSCVLIAKRIQESKPKEIERVDDKLDSYLIR